MTLSKKSFNVLRYAALNIVLGSCALIFPLLINISFFYALCLVLILVTLSYFNSIAVCKKYLLIPFQNIDDARNVKYQNKKLDKKNFTWIKLTILISTFFLTFYMGSVLFGAPVFEGYRSTLYFSVLMTFQVAIPLALYFFTCDCANTVFRIISESKFDNLTESHIHSSIMFSVVGAWAGAVVIPLDWDRPWQEWPIPCCIGAVLGNALSHFILGFRNMYFIYKERKKCVAK